jgi:5-(carboxyamino)imidazole ribonucleotide synthase
MPISNKFCDFMIKKPQAKKSQLDPQVIGIVGGGQLGRMIAFSAQKRGHRVVVLSNQANSPASQVVEEVILGDYSDEKVLKKFCDIVDIATIEFENIPYQAANFIAKHVDFMPSAEVLKITQNRLLEKNFLKNLKIKTTNYIEISSLVQLEKNLKEFKKAILKTASMGYDGKGQVVLDIKKDSTKLAQIYKNFANQQLILEKFCSFNFEISVIVVRSLNGEIICYDPLTNIHKNGILAQSIYPSKISTKLKQKAKNIAKKIAVALDLIGVLAVEFFVVDQELLVNELAARPHNSGHFSMDACITSQFEQLIRAITGSKLGSVDYFASGVMENLIGSQVLEIEKYQENPLCKIHLYGKNEVKEGRKMGHVNILNKIVKAN